jgi:hypothetical protein
MGVAAPYEQKKDRERQRNARIALAGRSIGPIPPVARPARRLAASGDFRAFCEAYHRPTFYLGWSDDHLKVIGQVEAAVLRGELFATAMPRGSGKTSLAEAGCEWAVLNGHHAFVCLIGSDEGAAEAMLDSIKTELEVNEALAEDYPEVCVAIAKLEGIANRCKGQTYDDQRTRIEWTAKAIVLPTLRPVGWADREDHRPFLRDDGQSLSSGAIIKVAGLTGGIRGMKHKRADGKTVRPTLVVPDDPQTDQSARSPSQCQVRERILAGAILGLAGPGKKIAGIMPCTVIAPGDVADSMLDRDKHPEWHGTRTKLVYAFPAAEKLWEEYARIRGEAMKAERGGAEATDFYRAHRSAMDEGARVAWPDRFNDDELSALQNAMNLRFDRGERAFAAEYQNQPLPEDDIRPDLLTPDQVAAKLNRSPRGMVPISCTRLTAMIDVHGSIHYYTVCAWEDDFTGYIVDYGTFPDQKRPYFAHNDVKHPLSDAFKAMGAEGQIYAGLQALADRILGREWGKDGGVTLRVERCLVDANWGQQTDLVYKFCRESAHAAVLTPSHGRGIGASAAPMNLWPRKPGDRVGLNWKMPVETGKRAIRKVQFDANYWKSFVHNRLAVAMGDKGSLSLFGDQSQAHRMYADHLTAEHPITVRREGSSRTVDEWRLKVGRDNHYLDTLVGACVAASMLGVELPESKASSPPNRPKRISFAELQKQRRA